LLPEHRDLDLGSLNTTRQPFSCDDELPLSDDSDEELEDEQQRGTRNAGKSSETALNLLIFSNSTESEATRRRTGEKHNRNLMTILRTGPSLLNSFVLKPFIYTQRIRVKSAIFYLPIMGNAL